MINRRIEILIFTFAKHPTIAFSKVKNYWFGFYVVIVEYKNYFYLVDRKLDKLEK